MWFTSLLVLISIHISTAIPTVQRKDAITSDLRTFLDSDSGKKKAVETLRENNDYTKVGVAFKEVAFGELSDPDNTTYVNPKYVVLYEAVEDTGTPRAPDHLPPRFFILVSEYTTQGSKKQFLALYKVGPLSADTVYDVGVRALLEADSPGFQDVGKLYKKENQWTFYAPITSIPFQIISAVKKSVLDWLADETVVDLTVVKYKSTNDADIRNSVLAVVYRIRRQLVSAEIVASSSAGPKPEYIGAALKLSKGAIGDIFNDIKLTGISEEAVVLRTVDEVINSSKGVIHLPLNIEWGKGVMPIAKRVAPLHDQIKTQMSLAIVDIPREFMELEVFDSGTLVGQPPDFLPSIFVLFKISWKINAKRNGFIAMRRKNPLKWHWFARGLRKDAYYAYAIFNQDGNQTFFRTTSQLIPEVLDVMTEADKVQMNKIMSWKPKASGTDVYNRALPVIREKISSSLLAYQKDVAVIQSIIDSKFIDSAKKAGEAKAKVIATEGKVKAEFRQIDLEAYTTLNTRGIPLHVFVIKVESKNPDKYVTVVVKGARDHPSSDDINVSGFYRNLSFIINSEAAVIIHQYGELGSQTETPAVWKNAPFVSMHKDFDLILEKVRPYVLDRFFGIYINKERIIVRTKLYGSEVNDISPVVFIMLEMKWGEEYFYAFLELTQNTPNQLEGIYMGTRYYGSEDYVMDGVTRSDGQAMIVDKRGTAVNFQQFVVDAKAGKAK